jgi:hypothetical protein
MNLCRNLVSYGSQTIDRGKAEIGLTIGLAMTFIMTISASQQLI